MPIYAYKCQGCGHQLEKIQRLSDAPLTDCPECSQPQLKKQITAAAFKLTGTGWYETDFKNNNKNNKKDSEKTTSKDGASTDSKPSDSKSEKKSTSVNKTSKKDAA